jgi:phage tail sheath protein FI
MPTAPTYPGVYIEEVPSGVRTISGVATSVAAFVDFFARGPMNRAVQVLNMGDFEREFGGLDARSVASEGRWGNALHARVDAAPNNSFIRNPVEECLDVMPTGATSGSWCGS